jgi:hypothetical protein
MIMALTRRLSMRAAALLAIAMLMVAALAATLAYSLSARPAVADNGVLHGFGIVADNGVLHGYGALADGGAINPNSNGVIHGF